MNPSKFKDWIPPKIWNWLRYSYGGFHVVDSWPGSTTNGWKYAVTEAAMANDESVRRMLKGQAIGVLPEESLDILPDRTMDFHHWIMQFVFIVARSAMGRDELKLLDFGGGFGTHALALKRMLPSLRVEYTVCDLPEFCKIGEKLNQNVTFISDLEQADTDYQLVYASSSIQYIKNWQNLIAHLCKISNRYIFITRTPFVLNHSPFIAVQKAYGTEYPGWVFNFHDFVKELQGHDMRLSEVFINGRGNPVKASGEMNIHLGLLFEKSIDKVKNT